MVQKNCEWLFSCVRCAPKLGSTIKFPTSLYYSHSLLQSRPNPIILKMMTRPIVQVFFFILFYFQFYVGTKPTTVRIFDGEKSYFEPKYARSCLEYRTHYVAKSHSYANAHHLFLNIIFYIHHSAWRRGFGVLIVNQPLQNKLILQVLLFLCHCNALTDIK